jgi:hypothetical protein
MQYPATLGLIPHYTYPSVGFGFPSKPPGAPHDVLVRVGPIALAQSLQLTSRHIIKSYPLLRIGQFKSFPAQLTRAYRPCVRPLYDLARTNSLRRIFDSRSIPIATSPKRNNFVRSCPGNIVNSPQLEIGWPLTSQGMR